MPLPSTSLDHSVLTHLHRDFVPLMVDQTVREAMAMLRGRQLGERIVYFYVTDPDGRLHGVVPTRRLLMAGLDTPIRSLMVRDVVKLSEKATVREASDKLLRHRFLALPVVDGDSKLLGVVDAGLFAEDVESITERPSVDDVFQLIGVHVTRALGPWRSFRERFPWLLTNVAGGLLAGYVTSQYQELVDRVLALAIFIPLVLALGESVSVQSVTLTLQAMHGDRPAWRDLTRALWKEARAAVLLGAASGLLVGLVALVWQSLPVAAVVGVSILLSMVTACLLGVALPMLMRLLSRDPRIASGPIVLALSDLATLLFYFNIGIALLT